MHLIDLRYIHTISEYFELMLFLSITVNIYSFFFFILYTPIISLQYFTRSYYLTCLLRQEFRKLQKILKLRKLPFSQKLII
jgi:hypothetical protein